MVLLVLLVQVLLLHVLIRVGVVECLLLVLGFLGQLADVHFPVVVAHEHTDGQQDQQKRDPDGQHEDGVLLAALHVHLLALR